LLENFSGLALIVFCSSQEGPLDKPNHPLAGKIVVVTRAPEQSQDLSGALEALGAQVRWLPMVAFAPPENPDDLDSALRRFTEFDWILFTSQNAVRFLFRRGCEVKARRAVQPPRPLIAAVGAATAQAARNLDIRVDYVAQTHTGESLAIELRDRMSGAAVLLPRSDRADDRLPVALREAGAHVFEVVAYRTVMPDNIDPVILDSVRTGGVSAILFASPSAFENFRLAVGPADLRELSKRVQLAAIGPATAAAIRESGARVAIESNESSASGLANAVARYYQDLTHPARLA
jgi:uroporphyrinogen-III synthase